MTGYIIDKMNSRRPEKFEMRRQDRPFHGHPWTTVKIAWTGQKQYIPRACIVVVNVAVRLSNVL